MVRDQLGSEDQQIMLFLQQLTGAGWNLGWLDTLISSLFHSLKPEHVFLPRSSRLFSAGGIVIRLAIKTYLICFVNRTTRLFHSISAWSAASDHLGWGEGSAGRSIDTWNEGLCRNVHRRSSMTPKSLFRERPVLYWLHVGSFMGLLPPSDSFH